MAHAYMTLHDAGAHDAQARAQALILGLGFKTTELNNPVNSFSGGWRMRLQLARALMCPSDLLLLDEPTNHLDLAALVWLESLEFLAFDDAFELAFDEQPASVPTSTAAANVVANALRRVPVRVMCSSCV